MAAFAISVFYAPNKIVNGGISGISTIMYLTFGIAPGFLIASLNIILLVLAMKFIGKGFVFDAVFCVALLSMFVQLFTYVPPITNDIFLATVIGSVVYGVGTGLTFVEGASTGGTDIISRLLQCAFPRAKIGSLLLMIDAAVIFVSLLVFKRVEFALYGAISLFISSYAINWLISKLNISKLAFVVTDYGNNIAKHLISNSTRGITIINAIGAYTQTSKNVLICALKENEVEKFQKTILKVDDKAFIIFSESSQIVGNGFIVYK